MADNLTERTATRGIIFPLSAGDSASWGNIDGTITDQTDLINYISEHGFTPTYVHASGSKTVNGYQVPQFTDNEIQDIYNAVVDGKPVVVVDENEATFFTDINDDVVSEEVFISFRYFDKMILEYGEGDVTNFSVIDNQIVSYYDTTNTYNTGDIVAHGARIYIATADNITGAWDSTKWNETDLQTIISALKTLVEAIGNIGKYLATWNCTTGKPTTNPSTLPYAYTTGDYYIIGTVGATNYMPDGTSYTGAASTTVDTDSPAVLDMYRFDGNVWTQLKFGEQFRQILSAYSTTAQMNAAIAAHHDSTKQDVISDLETIRSGAAAGATAYQKPASGIPASDLASGVIPTVPTALSDLTEDSTHRTVTDSEKTTWDGKQNALGYTPENVANKVTSISSSSTDTEYPSAKAVHTALDELKATAQTVTIAVADWSGGTTCTKSVTGVTASNIVIVDTSDGNVECTGQGNGTLTFTAMSTPTSAVTVKVVIL